MLRVLASAGLARAPGLPPIVAGAAPQPSLRPITVPGSGRAAVVIQGPSGPVGATGPEGPRGPTGSLDGTDLDINGGFF